MIDRITREISVEVRMDGHPSGSARLVALPNEMDTMILAAAILAALHDLVGKGALSDAGARRVLSLLTE